MSQNGAKAFVGFFNTHVGSALTSAMKLKIAEGRLMGFKTPLDVTIANPQFGEMRFLADELHFGEERVVPGSGFYRKTPVTYENFSVIVPEISAEAVLKASVVSGGYIFRLTSYLYDLEHALFIDYIVSLEQIDDKFVMWLKLLK